MANGHVFFGGPTEFSPVYHVHMCVNLTLDNVGEFDCTGMGSSELPDPDPGVKIALKF